MNKVKEYLETYKHIKQKHDLQLIEDVVVFCCVGIASSFLFWTMHADEWIFGSYTPEIMDKVVAIISNIMESVFGICIAEDFVRFGNHFSFYNQQGVYLSTIGIVADCSGVKQALQLILLILIGRGRFLPKLLFIPIGLIVVFCANLVRIWFITYAVLNFHAYSQILHDTVGRLIYYVPMFLVWVIWIENFADKKSNHSTKKQTL